MDKIELDHSDMVHRLFKPGEDILLSLTPEKCVILHAAIGIAGEAGELLDAIKKFVMYNKDLDFENVTEELGDLEFYMEALRQALNISRTFTLRHNKNKLEDSTNARYASGGYSDHQAQVRADKQQPTPGD